MQTKIVITFALLAVASAATTFYPHGDEHEVPILKQVSDIHPDGHYSYEYETGNGIHASENGVGGVNAQGQAQWTAPDGTPVQLSYIANENGYKPSGSHIPIPPPVPEQIVRALKHIRTHRSQNDETLPCSNRTSITEQIEKILESVKNLPPDMNNKSVGRARTQYPFVPLH